MLQIHLLSLLHKQYHNGEDIQTLTRYLHTENEEKIQSVSLANTATAHAFIIDREAFLAQIHYSWWSDAVQSCPPRLHPFLIALLEGKERERMEQMMGCQADVHPLSPFAKRYYQQLLFARLYQPGLPPFSALPSSPFLPLGRQSKDSLLEVFDLLGLYDIAEEILQIVDKNNLAALYSCLSPKKRAFLKRCLQHKERVSLSRLGLEHWSGEKKRLDAAIHRRGLFRFGKALQEESPSFLWYLLHRLDRGRAKIIEQYCQEKGNDKVRDILRKELLAVMQFLQIA